MYAVLDIETTGGKFNEEGITEIAIHRFDGDQVIDSFISLVNPEKEIQPFVVNLTGINQKMLKNAPKFYEVAKRILEITKNCVLVAHNADFDYRMLRLEFKRLGYEYRSKSLCTVSLSKILIPDLDSYKLGNLCRTLGIPMTDRHRANGDALATTKLFQLLLTKDTKKQIDKEISFLPLEKKLNEHLSRILETLPTETGTYYIHNETDQIIFTGSSKNIRKSVNKLLLSKQSRAKKVQKYAQRISHELTGSELMAQLLERESKLQLSPSFSKLTTRKSFTHALVSKINQDGYRTLHLENYDGRRNIITTFANKNNGELFIANAVKKFILCEKLVNQNTNGESCQLYIESQCNGACIDKEEINIYNDRVKLLIEENSFQDKSLLIIDRGRNVSEKSAVLIEKGKLIGVCFFNLNFQVHKMSILKNIIVPISHNLNNEHLLKMYLRRKKSLKIVAIHE